jgi:hypothetical protein
MDVKKWLASEEIDLDAIDSIDELSEKQKLVLEKILDIETGDDLDDVIFLTRKVKENLRKEWEAQDLTLRQKRLRKDWLEDYILLEDVRSMESRERAGQLS